MYRSVFLFIVLLPSFVIAQVRADTSFLKVAALVQLEQTDSALIEMHKLSLTKSYEEDFVALYLIEHKAYKEAQQVINQSELTNKAYLLAQIYALTGDEDAAIQQLSTFLNGKTKVAESEIKLNPTFDSLKGLVGWDTLWLSDWYSARERTVAEAQYLLQSGDFVAAIDTLTYALKKNKHDASFLYLRALAHFNMGNALGASRDVKASLQEQRTNTEGWLLSAQINYFTEAFEEAATSYQRYLSNKPYDFPKYIEWAKCLAKAGDFDKAAAVLEQYENYLGTDKILLWTYAQLAEEEGNYLLALQKLNAYIQKFGETGTVLKLRGICYYHVSMPKYSNRDLSFALDFFPHDPEILYFRGLSRLQLNHSGACEDLWLSYELGNREAYNVYMKHCD